MRQYGIRIANVALFTLCSFLAAGVFNQIAAEMLIPMRVASAKPPEARALSAATWTERKLVIDRNLFGSKLASEAPPPTPIVEEEVLLEETELPVKLLGTVAGGDPAISTAAITDTTSSSYQILRVGDFLEGRDEVRVAAIERMRVVLQNGLRLEELLLDEDAPIAAPKRSAPAARVARRRNLGAKPGANSRARRNTQNLEDRVRELETELGSGGATATLAAQMAKLVGVDLEADGQPNRPRTPAQLFSEARILPKYADGQMVGLELDAIKSGSIYQKLGLSNGDVITEVNGIAIDSPSATPEVLEQLSSAGPFHVKYTGSNGPQQITVSPEQAAAILQQMQ